MNLPRAGSNVSARAAGPRIAFPVGGAIGARRRRGKMFMLGNAIGSILYSPDGIRWRESVTGLAAIAGLAAGNGIVVANDGGGAVPFKIATDNDIWTDTPLTLAAIPMMFSQGYFYVGDRSSLDGLTWEDNGVSTSACMVVKGKEAFSSAALDFFHKRFGRYIQSGIVTGLNAIAIIGKGEIFGETIYLPNTTTATALKAFSKNGYATVVDVSPGAFNIGQYGVAASPSRMVVVGAAGNIRYCDVLGSLSSSDFKTATSFTASALNVCLWNGELFVAAGAAGVCGISYDGINWSSITTGGGANAINCGCISETLFPTIGGQ